MGAARLARRLWRAGHHCDRGETAPVVKLPEHGGGAKFSRHCFSFFCRRRARYRGAGRGAAKFAIGISYEAVRGVVIFLA